MLVFVTNHVLAGALIGLVCRDRPVTAFGAGFVSHVAMDLTPHCGDTSLTDDEFFVIARRDGLAGLAVLAVVLGACGPPRRSLMAGIVGAVLLDLDKPCRHLLGIDPFPSWLNRFHVWIQNESPDRLAHEIAAGSALAAAVAAAGRRGRSGRSRRGTRRVPRAA